MGGGNGTTWYYRTSSGSQSVATTGRRADIIHGSAMYRTRDRLRHREPGQGADAITTAWRRRRCRVRCPQRSGTTAHATAQDNTTSLTTRSRRHNNGERRPAVAWKTRTPNAEADSARRAKPIRKAIVTTNRQEASDTTAFTTKARRTPFD